MNNKIKVFKKELFDNHYADLIFKGESNELEGFATKILVYLHDQDLQIVIHGSVNNGPKVEISLVDRDELRR